MLRHVRGENHVNDGLAKHLPLLLVQIVYDVARLVLQKLEGHGQVVVFEYGLVVVHDGEFGAGRY